MRGLCAVNASRRRAALTTEGRASIHQKNRICQQRARVTGHLKSLTYIFGGSSHGGGERGVGNRGFYAQRGEPRIRCAVVVCGDAREQKRYNVEDEGHWNIGIEQGGAGGGQMTDEWVGSASLGPPPT